MLRMVLKKLSCYIAIDQSLYESIAQQIKRAGKIALAVLMLRFFANILNPDLR